MILSFGRALLSRYVTRRRAVIRRLRQLQRADQCTNRTSRRSKTLTYARENQTKILSATVVIKWKVFSERELMFMFAICRRPSVCLSVCLSVVCTVRAPYSADWNFRQYFYMIRKIIYPSFLRRSIVGGGRPLLREILGHPTPVGAKSPIFNRYSP